MKSSNKTTSLVCAIVGISLAVVSFFIFAFLSIPSFILGVIAVVLFTKDKKAGNPTSVAVLVCGIISIILGLVGFILMIVNMITLINNAAPSAVAIAFMI